MPTLKKMIIYNRFWEGIFTMYSAVLRLNVDKRNNTIITVKYCENTIQNS